MADSPETRKKEQGKIIRVRVSGIFHEVLC